MGKKGAILLRELFRRPFPLPHLSNKITFFQKRSNRTKYKLVRLKVFLNFCKIILGVMSIF